ncbi:hypothetical protein ZWY2020_043128 [Hordeum vulgare]|nr:hypothetical protein ZWY2020_043128 [Hordeum vulgare]
MPPPAAAPAEAPAVLPPVATPPPVAEAPAVLPLAKASSKSKNKHKRKRSGKKKSPAPAPEQLSPPAPIAPEPTTVEDVSGPAPSANDLRGSGRQYRRWGIVVQTTAMVPFPLELLYVHTYPWLFASFSALSVITLRLHVHHPWWCKFEFMC